MILSCEACGNQELQVVLEGEKGQEISFKCLECGWPQAKGTVKRLESYKPSEKQLRSLETIKEALK